MFEVVRCRVAGVCEFCAGAFHVKEKVREADIQFLSEYEGHPSLRQRVTDGYEAVTF